MNNNNIYYASIDKVLSKRDLRFSGNYQEILCALGNICHSETPNKEYFSCVAKLYKIDGEILEAEQKMHINNAKKESSALNSIDMARPSIDTRLLLRACEINCVKLGRSEQSVRPTFGAKFETQT